MTKTQKLILEHLLNGATVAIYPNGSRLRDAKGNAILKLHPRTANWMRRNIMRKDKSSKLWLIDKRLVRKFHGNSIVKRKYKAKLNEKKDLE